MVGEAEAVEVGGLRNEPGSQRGKEGLENSGGRRAGRGRYDGSDWEPAAQGGLTEH